MVATSPGSGRQLLLFYGIALLIPFAVMAVWMVSFASDPGATGFWLRMVDYAKAQSTYFNLPLYIRFAQQEPMAFWIPVYAGAPTIAALIVAFRVGGGAGLKRLVRKLHPWPERSMRSSALRTYGLLLALHLAVSAFLLGRLWADGGSTLDRALALMGGTPLMVAGVILFGAFLDEGGLLEELGWRGMAQPLLLDLLRHPLFAATVLGTLWWAWHLPRDIPLWLGGGFDLAYLGTQAQFLMGCILMSIIILYFTQRTGGSVLPAILIHGWTNLWTKALIMPAPDLFKWEPRAVITIAGALLVLAIAGRALGVQPATLRTRVDAA